MKKKKKINDGKTPQQRYVAKQIKKGNLRCYSFQLYKSKHKEIIEFLDSLKCSKRQFIISAIEEKMEKIKK